jgi:hypothetical protein
MARSFCELRIVDPDKIRGHAYESRGERGDFGRKLPFNLNSVPLKYFGLESLKTMDIFME